MEVSPLENALLVVENKNQELRTLIGQYQHKQLHSNVNLLSMTLNGVVDAAVNGGVARYQEVQWGDGKGGEVFKVLPMFMVFKSSCVLMWDCDGGVGRS